MKIWKYQLPLQFNEITMPHGATVIHVARQDGTPTLWALVNPEAPVVQRRFFVCGTGHEIGHVTAHDYVGTFFDGPFVWHVFEGRR